MTKQKVHRYYTIFSIVTLLVSIGYLLIPAQREFQEKIEPAIVMNIGFHLVYQFLSRVPIGMYERAEKDKPQNKELANKILTIFSIIIMIMPFLAIFGLLKSILANQYYERLFVLFIFAGVFLGGYSSKMKLKEKIVSRSKRR